MVKRKKVKVALTLDPIVWAQARKLFSGTGISASQYIELTLRHGMDATRSLGDSFRLFADDLSTMVDLSKKPPKPKRPPGRPKKVREEKTS